MRIAIVKLSALGDIIHSMVVLEYIKKAYPNAYIEWIVESRFAHILYNNPHIDHITELNLKELKKKKSLSMLKEQVAKIKELGEFDIAIDLQGLIKSALVTYLIDAKHRWGFDKHSTREGLASLFYSNKATIAYSANVIDRNCYLVSKALDIEIGKEEILAKNSSLYYSSDIGTYKEYIVLITGASTANKMYPKERLLELSKLFDIDIYAIWGSAEEESIAEYLAQNSDVHKAPKFTLDELKAFIAHSRLVIGADTGPTHMAWALNIPSITIFGNTPEYRNTYTTDINKTIKSDSIVDPLKLDKSDFSIAQIEPKDIYTIAKELLDG
jgi:heptosyltransferase-1